MMHYIHATIVFVIIAVGTNFWWKNHMPKFDPKDCISDTIGLEEWEKQDHEILKIVKVGKSHYLLMDRKPTYNGEYSYDQKVMDISGQTLYEKVECPPDMSEPL